MKVFWACARINIDPGLGWGVIGKGLHFCTIWITIRDALIKFA